MKTKNFLVAGIVGGIVDFFLGWIFYGMLFKDSFPQPDESSNAMVMIFLGCITFGLFLAYIYTKWAQIATAVTGAKAGAVIGFFIGLSMNFFNMAMTSDAAVQTAALDVGIGIVMTAIVGAVVGLVNGKLG
jgi:hypothetical protein